MDARIEYELIDTDAPAGDYETPPESFLKECEEYWANTMKPFYMTMERKIGNTTYVIETEFAGRESLADKLRRMMMGDDEK